MKLHPFPGALAALVLFVAQAFAADSKPAEKTPADLAYDETVKLIDNKDAKQDQARLNAVSKAGIQFLVANPTHAKAGTVVDKMISWVGVLKDKQRGMRSIFYAQVQGELLGPLFDDKLSEESKAAVLALDSAMAEGIFRENATQGNLQRWREKLDAQLKAKSVRDLLKDRVAAHYDVLSAMSSTTGGKFLNELTESDDKSTGNWAKAEAKLAELRKAPLALSFTAIDGTAVDVAEHRGKMVCLFFWSVTTKDLPAKTEALRTMVTNLGQKNFAIVGICVDKETEREKVLATVKDAKMKWPTLFDGQGDAGDVCKTFGVTAKSLPVMHLLSKEGVLLKTPTGKLSFDQKSLEAETAKVFQPKKK